MAPNKKTKMEQRKSQNEFDRKREVARAAKLAEKKEKRTNVSPRGGGGSRLVLLMRVRAQNYCLAIHFPRRRPAVDGS